MSLNSHLVWLNDAKWKILILKFTATDAPIPSKYQTVLLSCFLFQDTFTHIAIKKVYYHTYFKWYSGADRFGFICLCFHPNRHCSQQSCQCRRSTGVSKYIWFWCCACWDGLLGHEMELSVMNAVELGVLFCFSMNVCTMCVGRERVSQWVSAGRVRGLVHWLLALAGDWLTGGWRKCSSSSSPSYTCHLHIHATRRGVTWASSLQWQVKMSAVKRQIYLWCSQHWKITFTKFNSRISRISGPVTLDQWFPTFLVRRTSTLQSNSRTVCSTCVRLIYFHFIWMLFNY